jgi:C1A family cysteine protease
MFPDKEDVFFAKAAQRKIASYYNLRKNTQDWKKCLATHGPVLTALNIDDTWRNAAHTDGQLEVFQPATVEGSHSICIVGYTRDRFIIRNSWGEDWGDEGFGYASQQYITDAFFDEAYSVTV